MTQDTKIVDGIKQIHENTQKTLDSIKNKQKIEATLENFFEKQQKLQKEDSIAIGISNPENYNKINKNNYNNKKIIKDNYQNNKFSLDEVASLSLGQEVGVVYPPVEKAADQIQPDYQLPPKFRTLKIDLFNNSKDPIAKPYDYTLKMSVYLYNKCEQNDYDQLSSINYAAKFNNTGLDLFNVGIIKSDPHYALARRIRDDVYVYANQKGIEHISLNKFYRPSTAKKLKRQYVKNISGMLIRTANEHIFAMILQNNVYSYTLKTNKLTAKQKRVGIIASALIRAEDNIVGTNEDAADYLL